jgi:D-alanyl-D-alanine carboxypeptidase
MHLRGLLGQRRHNYLSPDTYQLMHFGKPAYAYGWAVEKLDTTGALVSFHDGSVGTFYCHTILVPSQKVAFVLLTNQGGDAAENACIELRICLNKLYLQGAL